MSLWRLWRVLRAPKVYWSEFRAFHIMLACFFAMVRCWRVLRGFGVIFTLQVEAGVKSVRENDAGVSCELQDEAGVKCKLQK